MICPVCQRDVKLVWEGNDRYWRCLDCDNVHQKNSVRRFRYEENKGDVWKLSGNKEGDKRYFKGLK
jgi:hypothetical protein